MPFVCAVALRLLCLCEATSSEASHRAEVPRHFLKVQWAECKIYNTKWQVFNGFSDMNVRKGLMLSCILLLFVYFVCCPSDI